MNIRRCHNPAQPMVCKPIVWWMTSSWPFQDGGHVYVLGVVEWGIYTMHRPAPKFWSKSNDSLYALWSPVLNQMIRDPKWNDSKQWIIFRCNALIDLEFREAPFQPSLRLFKIITSDVEIRKWMAFLILFLLVLAWTEWSKSQVWINRSGPIPSRHFNVDSPVNQRRVPWLNQRWIMFRFCKLDQRW